MKTFTERFDEGIASVTGDRGRNYGHPADNFSILSKLREPLQQCDDPVMRQAMEMVAVKLARLVENPYHFDSWLDVAGYARTACMVLDRMQQNTNEGKPLHDEVVYATRRQDRV